MQTGTQLRLGMNPGLESQEPAYDLFEKSWHLRNFRGCGHSAICGAVAIPVTLSKFPLRLSSDAGALIQRQGVTFKSCLIAPRLARISQILAR